MKVQFAPSVLSADFAHLGKHVQEAAAAGAEVLHFDVMDGRFVPNITFGPMVIKAVRDLSAALFETHLMIIEPEKYVDGFAAAGADRILVHPEVSPHLHRVLQQIRSAGAEPGVALNPSTSLDCLDYVMDDIDCILVMTVNPGFGGQEFIPQMLRKIADVRERIERSGRRVWLGVDGGINKETVASVVAAGADLVIAGSSVFNSVGSVAKNLDEMRSALTADTPAG